MSTTLGVKTIDGFRPGFSCFDGMVFDRKEYVHELVESGAYEGYTYKELAEKTDADLLDMWIKSLYDTYCTWCD